MRKMMALLVLMILGSPGVVNTANEAMARESAAAWNRLLAAAVALLLPV